MNKAKTKIMTLTTPREETVSAAPQKAKVHLEIHAQSSMNATRKAKGRDDLVHLLRQVHRTEIQKVTEKVVMREAQKAHQNLLVTKSVRESKQATL